MAEKLLDWHEMPSILISGMEEHVTALLCREKDWTHMVRITVLKYVPAESVELQLSAMRETEWHYSV